MEKYFASLSCGRMSWYCVSVWPFDCMIEVFGSRHSQSVPLLLVMQTNELTQSVGLSTLVMMPCWTSVSSTFLSGSRSALGTRHGG